MAMTEMQTNTAGRARRLISARFSSASAPPTANLRPSQLPLIAEVRSKLQSGEYVLERTDCPCGGQGEVVISEVDRYGLPLTSVVCVACGTVRMNPYLDDASLEDFYTRFYQQMYARATDVQGYFERQHSYGAKVLSAAAPFLKPGGLVYEVGCGAGGALKVFQDQGYGVAGCDYSAELIEEGRRRGVRNIFHGTLEDIETGGERADLIYLHHVFEHIHRPLDFLERCRRQLKPGGRVLIVVPDVSRIDGFTCPAGDLLQFLHIAHIYNFSFEGLRRLGRRAGYDAGRVTPDASIWTPCSHMPELWVEFTDAGSGATRTPEPAAAEQGPAMVRYLRRTERLYSWGLCKGQLLCRMAEGKSPVLSGLVRLKRLTPAKVLRKVGRMARPGN